MRIRRPISTPERSATHVWPTIATAILGLLILTTPRLHGQPRADSSSLFTEEARSLGIDFVHRNGFNGNYDFTEINGAGCGVLDYDNDGDLDLYFVQGGGPPNGPEPSSNGGDRLFRNELISEVGSHFAFTDATMEAGIAADGYGFGVATGDFDRDGWIDLYITNYGANQLWHNRGDGTFEERAVAAGVAVAEWSVSALFFDYDGDGWLDLYVGNYVDFDPRHSRACRTAGGAQDYCAPAAYVGVADRLFRNRRDGTFEDVSIASAIGLTPGKSLAAISGDFDRDGRMDLYVANDQEPNFLWLNQGDGRLRNEALMAGAAVNGLGQAEASMGIAAADFDDDGDEDLFVTHLVKETNTLYRASAPAVFEDATAHSGVGPPSLPNTGWGGGWIDFDNDSRLDLFIANGAVRTNEVLARSGDPFPFHERNQLLRQLDGGRFVDVSATAGAAFELSEVSRGAAFGDLDNDGDTDIALNNNGGPARVLINVVGERAHWLGLRLVAGQPAVDQLGAWVSIERTGHATLHRRVRSDGSFASAHDPRILVGLDDSPDVAAVRVRWPDGTSEEWHDLDVGVYVALRRGEGR